MSVRNKSRPIDAARERRIARCFGAGSGARLGLGALFLLGTTFLIPIAPARADLSDGVRFYDSGDYTRAYGEWLPLARAGHAAAQRNIGQLYRLGLGVPQDLKVAANWYRLAARQGLARAQSNLAAMYLRGEGVEQDFTQAVAWFRRAAAQGHTLSQYNLDVMYQAGYGVEKSGEDAQRWFQLAANAGHGRAAQRLADLGPLPQAFPETLVAAPVVRVETFAAGAPEEREEQRQVQVARAAPRRAPPCRTRNRMNARPMAAQPTPQRSRSFAMRSPKRCAPVPRLPQKRRARWRQQLPSPGQSRTTRPRACGQASAPPLQRRPNAA